MDTVVDIKKNQYALRKKKTDSKFDWLRTEMKETIDTVKTHDATNSIFRPTQYYGHFFLVPIFYYNFNVNSTQ